MRRITGILLAAGASRRFGSPKLLAPLDSGLEMGVQSARHLRAVLDDVIVIVRPDDSGFIQRLQTEAVTVLPCVRAAEGMGASLACGVAATSGSDAWLVALADMPFIKPATIRQLVEGLQQGQELVAPVHAGQRGHPVGFGAVFGEQLAALSGDVGARALLTRHAGRLVRVGVEDPGVLTDIDTRTDLLDYIRRNVSVLPNSIHTEEV